MTETVPNFATDIRDMMIDDAISALLRLHEELPVRRVERVLEAVAQAKIIYLDESVRREYSEKIDRQIAEHKAARDKQIAQDFLRRESDEDAAHGA